MLVESVTLKAERPTSMVDWCVSHSQRFRGSRPFTGVQIAGGLNKPGFVRLVSRWEADTALRFIRRGTGLSCCGGDTTFKSISLFFLHPCGRREK